MPRLPVALLGLLAVPLPAAAQNDVNSPDTPVAVWKFDATGEPGVPKTAAKFLEPGPRPPVYPAFAQTKVGSDPDRLKRIHAAKMPAISKPISFDDPSADPILAALEVFPPDNPWNLLVEDWPLHPNSKNIVASIGVDKPFRYNPDMGFVLVPPAHKKVDVKIVGYPDESDKGPFPVPDLVPIEGYVNVTRGPSRRPERRPVGDAPRPPRCDRIISRVEHSRASGARKPARFDVTKATRVIIPTIFRVPPPRSNPLHPVTGE